MTSLVIQSNNTSEILRSLEEMEAKDLSYQMKPSYPILAKTVREVVSNNTVGTAAGVEVVFNLNKAMLLRNMLVKTVFTVATGPAVDSYPGLDMYERIELRSNNKVITTLSGDYLRARVANMPEYAAQAIYRRALPLVATTEVPVTGTGGATLTTYTPIFCSFFENFISSLDLSFYEQLQVVCRFNTTELGGQAAAITAATCTLWVWTTQLNDRAADILRSQNQKPSVPLSMLSYNTYTERITCNSTTASTIRLNLSYPVFATHVMIRTKATGAFIVINSFDFAVGGTKLIESCPKSVGNYEAELMGSSKMRPTTVSAVTRTDPEIISLFWGQDPKDYTYNSGSLSFNNINYPLITLNHATITAANHEVVVVHSYWQILSLDSGNGSVAVSRSY